MRHDYPRLTASTPAVFLRPENVSELQEIIRDSDRSLPMVISGARNSHGNHLIYHGPHLTIDMTGLDMIEGLAGDILTIGAGSTWQAIQDHLWAHGRSPIVQQSSYAFTVGGSIAGNIHGRDIRRSTIEHGIEWMEIVLADGSLKRASRAENDELFWAMFGSQSLLGIIARVGLRTTTNHVMQARSLTIPTDELNDWFEVNKKSIDFFIARPSVADGLMHSLITVWKAGAEIAEDPLTDEKNWRRDRFIFWISTKYRPLMRVRWQLERLTAPRGVISRINAMRPPVVPLKMFMTASRRYSYAVQEIFVPKSKLAPTVAAIAELDRAHAPLRLAGVTIRHIARQKAPMGYAGTADHWAVMQYWRVPRTPLGLLRYSQLQARLGKAASDLNGKLYLSYTSSLPAREVLRQYPYLKEILRLKKKLDPNERLVSDFYVRLSAASKESDG